MKRCEFSKVDGGIACGVCGRVVSGDRPTTTVAICGLHRRRGYVAIGDLVASALSSVGITEERVSSLLGRPCGCSGRRARMNQAGYLVQFKAARAATAAYRAVMGE